jgi:Mrp family chromosome partitioning ATPase
LQNILKRLTLLSPAAPAQAAPAEQSGGSASAQAALSPSSSAAVTSALPSANVGASSWEAMVATHLAEPAVEQDYRQLAERMLENCPSGVAQNILLTSVGCPAEETLGRLAWTLAEIRGPVLMLDANRARTSLTIQLQRTGAAGLEELLRGEAAAALPTTREKLFLLPAGNRATDGNAAELTALAAALAKWRGDFPLVLIDGGDALSEAATLLSRLCDATYLLVGLGAATTDSAREATRRFRAAGGRLLGCIAVESAAV